jgi:hypothetical protein
MAEEVPVPIGPDGREMNTPTDEHHETKGFSIADHFQVDCGEQSWCWDLPYWLYVESEDRGRLPALPLEVRQYLD